MKRLFSQLTAPLAGVVLTAVALFGAAGCTTDAFCFNNCNSGSDNVNTGSTGQTGSGNGTGGADGGGCILNCGGGGGASSTGSSMDGGICVPTNAGIEICDKLDNDCNGLVDDLPGLDLKDPHTCGTCDNNCYTLPTNWDPLSVKCTPSPMPGTIPGTCTGTCAQDYYDIDKNGSCEYYCTKTAPDDTTCNNLDDDCNGVKDDGVDFCSSLTDCGACGNNCVILHGSQVCKPTGAPPCNGGKATCQIKKCDCNGPGDCWWDLDGNPANGCEYQCDLTNGGVEICDGLDNDCDGKIDAADDLSGDPKVGDLCYGSLLGECGTPAHSGITTCVGAQIVCTGPNVLVPNQQQETCNGKDDDCDGVIDNNPTDAGGACGVSNIFPCTFGTKMCVAGALVCIGEKDPGVEVCNGIDDDCDGQIDKSNGMPPADSVGVCNVPIPPPAGATSPCKAGAKACVGGTVQCIGSVGPSSMTDGCGDDSNCDGMLTNQPNTQTDVHNCGSCGNDCLAGAVHANWGCNAGVCVFQGCQVGYWDLNNDNKCEYPCVFVSAQETCNGVDDNCNGQIDEGVIAPTPVQVCGVNPAAMSPECTSGVTVACQAGGWKCTFPAGVCNPTCAGATELCDGKDNNCNGLTDENVPNIGKPCASDDGLPPPGDGACRTVGTYVCNGLMASKCSAVKNLAAAGPELCDGIDNDCDGLVDEPFSNKGSNAMYFVKPAATKIAANLWVMSYEASRPNATAIVPGSGDGYYCAAFNAADPNCNDNTIPVAPAGVPLDKTTACSVQGKIPWFNVTPREAEQTCKARGGHLCTTADWTTACQATLPCTWGYNPRTAAACNSALTATKYCNLGAYDFNPLLMGDQDGLLVTGSPALGNCWADWSALQGNPVGSNRVFDITGNLREITKSGVNVYPLMGGAFDTAIGAESGAACSFQFYTGDQNFELFNLGFRCCFTADPGI